MMWWWSAVVWLVGLWWWFSGFGSARSIDVKPIDQAQKGLTAIRGVMVNNEGLKLAELRPGFLAMKQK